MPNQKQQSFWTSLRCAVAGVCNAFGSQRNFRIQLTMGGVAIGCGIVFQISRFDWCLIAICIGGVLVAELLNTSIEAVVDLASPEQHDLARTAKDVAAGAVLCSACAAIVVGLLIFVPHLLMWLN